jgi:membrane protease YdiL (CAAX protease family)
VSPVPATIFVAGGLALWVYGCYSTVPFFEATLAPRLVLGPEAAGPAPYFYWYGSTFLSLVLLPILALRLVERRAAPEERVASLGWGPGDWRTGLAAAALGYAAMVVVLVLVVPFGDFRGKYPLFPDAGRSVGMFVAYETAYVLYFWSWESFFRGFLTLGLAKTLGIWSVFVQMLPFVVVHYGKPDLEVMSSVFGGIALGYLALRTGSIWYGFLIHAATAITLDVLVLALR